MAEKLPSLHFGVLGTGRITRKVGPAIASTPGARLTAVASRDADRAATWASEFAADRSYGSYEALLDDPELDAIYIALPPHLHREWTEKAAERGLHVLCEKPLAVTLSDAIAMAEACRRHNVQLMDGVMWTHTPRAKLMRSVIESGALGDLQRVTSAFTFRSEGWDDSEFRRDPALGGGCLLDLGWYCVGASLWAFGWGDGGSGETRDRETGRGALPTVSPDHPIPRLPLVVSAMADFQHGADVTFSGLLRFSESRVASFDCGFQTSMRKWLEIAGTKGSIVCDDFTRPWSPEKARFWIHENFGKASEQRCEPFRQEECLVAAFCECVHNGPDHTWADRAVAVQDVCQRLIEAARESCDVEPQRSPSR